MPSYCLIIGLCLLGLAATEGDRDHWVWSSYNRRERSFRDIDRSSPIRNSYENKLRREPTTRRPLPGEPENDEIEDYADVEPTRSSDTPNVGTRQYNPYGGQANAGQFGGIGGGYGGSPGVLVGPGGPTGIIGRPPLYPNPYQPGYGGFTGAQNGIGGYPGGYGGVGQTIPGAGFPGANVGTGFNGYPGNGLGLNQFPSTGQYPYGSGFPGGDFSGSQFAAPGGQYPGLGQYPSNQQFGGPQYTEGYGLAGGLGLGQLGLGGNGGVGGYGGNFPPLGGFGFDEKSPAVAEGKSAKSVAAAPRTVNDKITKKV